MKKRNTIKCALVLEAVNKLRCHATADEIYQAVVLEHPHISKATVYRNLQRLCETGEIRKRELPGEPDRFDHLSSNHYHAKCVRCGHILMWTWIISRTWKNSSRIPTGLSLPGTTSSLKASARPVKITHRRGHYRLSYAGGTKYP